MKWFQQRREQLEDVLSESVTVYSIPPSLEPVEVFHVRQPKSNFADTYHADLTLPPQQVGRVKTLRATVKTSTLKCVHEDDGQKPQIVLFSRSTPESEWIGDFGSYNRQGGSVDIGLVGCSKPDVLTDSMPCGCDALTGRKHKIANHAIDIDANVENVQCLKYAFPSWEFSDLNSELSFAPEIRAPNLAFQVSAFFHLPEELFPASSLAQCVVHNVSPLTILVSVFTVPTVIAFSRRRCFGFERYDHEPRPLFSDQIQRVPRGNRLQPVEVPEPPPASKEMSLQERLLSLLTPPIHELLADPELALSESPFPFQMVGIKWLLDRDEALLADEMGLGKTMQAIIAARLLFRSSKISQIMIVCPKSLIPNWKSELQKWWPNVSNHIKIAGPADDRRMFLRLGTKNVVVKIVNYEKLGKELDWLKKQDFSHDLVILDEAQNIKNSSSSKAQAVKALKAKKRWAITGTPLENHLDDVISIFGFVKPNLLSKLSTVDEVRDRIRPYFLRRKTEDVSLDLPDLLQQTIEIELSDGQQEAYDRLEREAVIELNSKGDSITVQHVFAQIQKLKQLCNFDPKTGESAKLERLLEDFEEISAENRKALVFSQFVSDPYGLKTIANHLENNGHRVLQFHGEVSDGRRNSIKEEFCTSSTHRALLLNYKTGGVGLNLQVANYVFLFDRWWNPAVEDQAIKRAHRIGAEDKVFVRRFICMNTIEERIDQVLSKKRQLFQQVIDDTRPDAMGFTEDEIFSLFDIKVRPRRRTDANAPPRRRLDGIDWKEFQQIVALIYERQNYSVRVAGNGPDGGVDVIAERHHGTSIERIFVQCKHQTATVGRPVCQQLLGAISADAGVTSGALFTSATFSSQAIVFASGKRLKLFDRMELIKLCREYKIAEIVAD